MNLTDIKKVHLIGIGGIGVSTVAKFFLYQQKEVTGSDVYPTALTKSLEKAGIKVFDGQRAENLSADLDLIIYSPAVGENNPERQKAAELKIRQLSYPDFLGELSKDYQTIAVSGTNGKSTTTAMIGKIFEAARLDPTVFVGTQVPGFDGNLRLGKSDLLIVEACEWKAHMLKLSPQVIVLTNLELDHTDYYKDIDDLKNQFQKFIDGLPAGGLLAYNADDPNLNDLKKDKGYQVKSWSKNDQIDFQLTIPGDYNIANAQAAATVARHFNIPNQVIGKALADFPNCWRRFEVLGPMKNQPETLVVSDYAHHPTAIKGLLKAAREFYPGKRLVAVFQPHHYDRTAKLFDGFVKSFHDFDLLIINQIYDVAGRQKDGQRNISSEDLAREIKKRQPGKKIIYSTNLRETKNLILNNAQKGDLILVIGAGDIDEVAKEIV